MNIDFLECDDITVDFAINFDEGIVKRCMGVGWDLHRVQEVPRGNGET